MLGRESELENLQHYYEQPDNQIIVVYGQKNVGKTSLLLKFSKSHPSHYYLARPCSERQQQFLWSSQLQQSGSSLEAFPSFGDIFATIGQSSTQKKVLIIDEFLHIIKTSSTFMQELTAFLSLPENANQFFVILCSSQIGFIENSLISKIGATAYYLNGFFKVKELGFQSLVEFFPGFSTKEAIAAYSIFGGASKLWNYFTDSVSIRENICNTILNKTSVLYYEGERIIEEQLRETNVYDTILSVMASGRQKLNEIYADTGFSRAKISVYLKNLMELEIVEKVFSFDTEGREHTQKGIYRIKNHFVHFYFRFLYPHLSELQTMDAQSYYDTYLEHELDAYFEEYFPSVCLEYLDLMNQKGNLPIFYTKISEWVGKAGTIHMIAEDDDKKQLVGFCSFQKNGMTYEDYEWLSFCIEQAKVKPAYLYLFSIHGFDERLTQLSQKEQHIILIDMY